MDIESLRTFLVLSETKNFTRTANQVFVAQSTITNRISELEKELGVNLFTRSNRSVALTPEGERFKSYAEKVVELTDSSLTEITSLPKYENHIRIGAADSIYESHLVNLLLDYHRKHPKDSITMSIGLSTHLLEQLQDDILDVVFTYLPLNKANYHCSLFHQDKLVLVTDIRNEEYAEGITRKDLLTTNYLMCNFALKDVGQFIRNLFPKYHQFALEIDDCSKIIPYVLKSDSYTFLPEDMAKPYVDDKIMRIIPLLDLQTPKINSYIVGNNTKKKLWENIIHNKIID